MSILARAVKIGTSRFLTRQRLLGIVYLALGVVLTNAAMNHVDPAAISSLGFRELGRAPVPTQLSLLVISALLLGTAVVSWVWPLRGWTINLLVGLNFGAAILSLLLYLSADGSLDMGSLLRDSLRLATPIALGALAGVLCERAGVINIGIEGMMLAAAGLGFFVSLYTQNMWLGLAGAIIVGGLMAALHAVLSVRFTVDQIVSGTVINILAVGITGYVRRAFLLGTPFGAPGVFPRIHIPFLSEIPFFGFVLFQFQPMVYAMLLLVPLTYFMLFYTSWGLRTRAVGEHPRAADTVGINVYTIRYVNVIAAGCIAGLGGAWFSLETVGNFDDLMTGGKGFIALAAMIFGKWNPIWAAFGALIFGFAEALAFRLQILDILVPYQFVQMAPYFLTIIVLAGVMGKAIPPAADGQPYTKQ